MTGSHQPSGKKLALVIGYNRYKHQQNQLKYSIEAARQLADALTDVAFTVTVVTDNEGSLDSAIENFTESIHKGDLVVFYFCGHTHQVGKKTYLIPIDDSKITNEHHIRNMGIDVRQIIRRLVKKNRSNATVMIIDCPASYRINGVNNPKSESEENNFQFGKPIDGTFVQYLNTHGISDVGRSETSGGSVFTKHLVEYISEENLDVRECFRQTLHGVQTENQQWKITPSIDALPEDWRIMLNEITLKPQQPSGRKLALVIGHNRYSHQRNRLKYAVKTARQLADVLMDIDFDVTLITDDDESLKSVITDFTKHVSEGDLVLFYFCGHIYHISGKSYLIPMKDSKLTSENQVQDVGINVRSILRHLIERNRSNGTVMILDCPNSYQVNGIVSVKSMDQEKGLSNGKAMSGTLIQYTNVHDGATGTILKRDSRSLFTEYLLERATIEEGDVRICFQDIIDEIRNENEGIQTMPFLNGLHQDWYVPLRGHIPDVPYCVNQGRWKPDARIMVGGRGSGSTFDRLNHPKGIQVDAKQNLYVVDSSNHRIMKYYRGAKRGIRIVGRHGNGSNDDMLYEPSSICIHKLGKCLVFCDYRNRRVLKCSFRICKCGRTIVGNERCCEDTMIQNIRPQVIMENIDCYGLAIDNEENIYVSDTKRHEVRRYHVECRNGTAMIAGHGLVVAGGHGQGSGLNQLNHPTYIYLGIDKSVYVADSWNDRVVKWEVDAKEGVVVAGGRGKGSDRRQLNQPAGLLVDEYNTVYVADYWNHRIMRWRSGDCQGTVIAGRLRPGNNANQLSNPEGIAFDRRGNLYVADSNNHRIQKFIIENNH